MSNDPNDRSVVFVIEIVEVDTAVEDGVDQGE
jgi:hypothetical protein